MSALRCLAAIDAEINAIDRRTDVALLNGAPRETRIRLFWERVALAREWGRVNQLMGAPQRRAEHFIDSTAAAITPESGGPIS